MGERGRERVVKSKDCPKIGRGQLGRSVTHSVVFLCGIYQQKYGTLLSSGVCKSVCVCVKYLCKFVFVKSCDNTGFGYFWYFCTVFFRNFLTICCIYVCNFKCSFFINLDFGIFLIFFVCLVFFLVSCVLSSLMLVLVLQSYQAKIAIAYQCVFVCV